MIEESRIETVGQILCAGGDSDSDTDTIKGHFYEDERLPLSFHKKRHTTTISGDTAISKSWRIRDRMKTVSVALVVCLNVGVDPPDIFKITPCARLESWIDPSSVSPQKAMELIGLTLQKQYERWQPRARYKQSLDPTVDDVKKLCSSLRRNAKEERVLFHYNGHGVPRPTVNGEIWVFNRTYTQYIPLSIYDLQTWMGSPSIYVYDCSNAGIIVNSFNLFAEQHERELEQVNAGAPASNSPVIRGQPSSMPAPPNAKVTPNPDVNDTKTPTTIAAALTASPSTTSTTSTTAAGSGATAAASTLTGAASQTAATNTFRNCIQLAACSAHQILPMNPQLPADLFTACLTTPIKTALKWFTLQQTATLVPQVSYSLIERMPGVLNDRRSMLGELNWIFTAITDTIAWNKLPRDLFQKLFRQDLLVASLFRNFLLADRIMRSYDCTPISSPPLPNGHRHPMWAAWDLAVDLALQQLPGILDNNAKYVNSPFFEDQLTAFHVWLERGSSERNPPEQLPIVLQVLLSQVHRLRALELLGRFLDLGPWAVNLALSVGIFPYVLKLLQATARELRPLLVFIWAKILAVDNTCQVDLVCDKDHKYFLTVLQDTTIKTRSRTLAAFVLSSIVHNFPLGQANALQGSLISICLVQLNDPNALHRQWLAICLGHLWQNYDKARWSGVRDLAHEKLYPLLCDPVPEVRAAAVYALGTFISTQQKDRTEHANNIDRSIAIALLTTVGNDMSPVVRMELIAALQWMIILFENHFVSVFLQESSMGTTTSGMSPAGNSAGCAATTASSMAMAVHHNSTHSLERNINMKRVSSSSSIVNMSGVSSLATFQSTTIGFGSIYMKLWHGLMSLCRDPHPDVAQLAQKLIDYIVTQAVDLISAKEATKENFGSSMSLPPSPNTRVNYLGESPPAHINLTERMQHNGSRPPSALAQAVVSEAGAKMTLLPNGSVTALFPKRASNTSTVPSRSRKTSRHALSDDTAPGTDQTDSSEATSASQTTEPPKQIVSTAFIPWCVGHFSTPIWKQEPQHIDRHATEHLDRIWRFQRNEETRRVAKEQQRRAVFNRLETQSWVGRTQFCPHIVKLHPFELQIAVAYKNKIMVNDWSRSTIMSYVPQQLPTVASTTKRGSPTIAAQQSWVSALEFINGHDSTLILAGYDDGCIRIWRPPSEVAKESRLVTAWQAMSDVTANKFHHKSSGGGERFGLRTVWQQRSQTVIVAGDSKYLRCWDAETELSVCDIPTGADSAAVLVLSSAPNELIATGCTDGSVRLFDKRVAPAEARVKTYRETSGHILTACLRDDCGHLVTGCSQGSIRLFDVRQNASLSHWFVDGDVAAMSVHTSADILACGTNCISVYGLDGKLLSAIRPHGFMGPKVANSTCLSFHPLKVSLAAGFIDNTVAVYVSDTKRHQ